MKQALSIPQHLGGRIWLLDYVDKRVLHHHDELEVNVVLSGTGRYLVKDRRYDLRRNSVIWLFPDQPHLLLDQSPNCRMWIGVFKADLVARCCTTPTTHTLLKSDPPGEFARVIAPEAVDRLNPLFTAAMQHEQVDPALHNARLAYLMLQTWHDYNAAEHLAESHDIHPAVEEAARLLRAPGEPMTLNELADSANLSPSHLSRLFKEQTGTSLVGYRQRICVQRFITLFGDGRRMNMLQAATESGFGSYPQFHRVFKKVMGTSPAEYRRARLRGEVHGDL